ncbi:MAG TPA: PEP-CTERM sorting domain-containing protein [Terriglobales bacterium]
MRHRARWIELAQPVLWGLYDRTPLGHVAAWSNANGTGDASSTLSPNPSTGLITPYPSSLSFAVFGTPTAVPEPSSMLLLGSGVVGLAGVPRRKLMR